MGEWLWFRSATYSQNGRIGVDFSISAFSITGQGYDLRVQTPPEEILLGR